MPRLCTRCAHPQRAEIDGALVAGRTIRDIAGQFGIRKSAVARHKMHRRAREAAVIPEHSGTNCQVCEAVLSGLQTLRRELPQHPPGSIVEPLGQAVQAVETLKSALGTLCHSGA